jgi:hypothetical protein
LGKNGGRTWLDCMPSAQECPLGLLDQQPDFQAVRLFVIALMPLLRTAIVMGSAFMAWHHHYVFYNRYFMLSLPLRRVNGM